MTGAPQIVIAALLLALALVALWRLCRRTPPPAAGQVVVLGARGAGKSRLIAEHAPDWLEMSPGDPPPQGKITGVVLALSLADLLGLPATGRAAQARALGESLSQISPPPAVQILLTKADLLPGFAATDILSTGLPLTDAHEIGPVWDQLATRLANALPTALLQAPDPGSRGALSELPSHLAALRPALVELLAQIFAQSKAQALWLNMAALAPGAAPPDRLLPGMAQRFGLGRPLPLPLPVALPPPFLASFGVQQMPVRVRRVAFLSAGVALLALAGYGLAQVRAEHVALDRLAVQIAAGNPQTSDTQPFRFLPSDLPARLQGQVTENAMTERKMSELLARLERQITDSISDPVRLRSALAVYLTLGQIGPPDPAFVLRWFEHGDQALRDILSTPLPAAPLDADLVAQARGALHRQPQAQRLYSGLREAAQARGLRDLRLADLAGPQADAALSLATRLPDAVLIPGFYTPEGARKIVLPALADLTPLLTDRLWIEGTEATVPPGAAALHAIAQEVAGLYVQDYISHSQSVLEDLNIKAPATAAEQARVLALVQGASSPLRQLLQSLAENTRFDETTAALRPVTLHFRSLHQVLAASEGADLLTPVPEQEVAGARLMLARVAAPRGLLHRPLQRWSAQLSPGLATEARAGLTELWQSEILPLCEAVVTKRYPFDRTAVAETDPADFAALFAPDGRLETFRSRYLAAAVRGEFPTPELAPALVAQFARSAAITETYFAKGPQPGLGFTLQSEALAQEVTLQMNETAQRFTTQSEVAQSMFWSPGPGQASLQLGEVQLQRDGTWSWLRLLATAESRPAARRDLLRAVFTLAGRRVMFQIGAGAGDDPFALSAMAGFRCPRGI